MTPTATLIISVLAVAVAWLVVAVLRLWREAKMWDRTIVDLALIVGRLMKHMDAFNRRVAALETKTPPPQGGDGSGVSRDPEPTTGTAP